MTTYHYVQCGLGNIWLSNGFRVEQTPYGQAVSIDNAEALDKANANYLTEKPVAPGSRPRRLPQHEQQAS